VVLARFEQAYRDVGVALALRSVLPQRAPANPAALVAYVARPATLADLGSWAGSRSKTSMIYAARASSSSTPPLRSRTRSAVPTPT
jgi:hypothetical protein